ncbi:MAG: hypothetical protein ACI9N1_001195 [Flavobacteriales bacterium]|jgi:hypothetical protein
MGSPNSERIFSLKKYKDELMTAVIFGALTSIICYVFTFSKLFDQFDITLSFLAPLSIGLIGQYSWTKRFEWKLAVIQIILLLTLLGLFIHFVAPILFTYLYLHLNFENFVWGIILTLFFFQFITFLLFVILIPPFKIIVDWTFLKAGFKPVEQ